MKRSLIGVVAVARGALWRSVGRASIVGLLATAALVTGIAPHAASAGTESISSDEQLAQRYAPIVMVQTQARRCSSDGEPFTPMAVDSLFANPEIALRQVGRGDPVARWAPTPRDLFLVSDAFYLDFPGRSLAPGCTYERDYRRFNAGRPPTVYAHTVVQREHPDQFALQYWFFWYYNDWGNTHEGDWESIQIVFPASTAAGALLVEPTSVGFAQHEGGERVAWRSDRLEREGDRVIVYPSAGSHASYFGSALYLGRNGNEGFGCDDTGGHTTRLDPVVVLLPATVRDPEDPMAWLMFDGRWGERERGPFNGPTGPADKGRWTRPIDWHDSLRDGSVVVPGGDGAAASLANVFCRGVEIGSDQLIGFKHSPTRGLLALAVVGGLAIWLTRRTVWTSVEPLPVQRRRAAGQVARAAPRVVLYAPVTFGIIAIAAVPLAVVAGALAAVAGALPLFSRVISLAQDGDAARLAVSLITGSLAGLLASTVISAAVACVMGELSAGRTPSAGQVGRALAARAGALASGLLRAVVIVTVSFATIVGIPFGIHRAVAYQYLPQTVMLEGCAGRDALRRSAALVRRRWWRTAVFIGAIQLAVVVVAGVVGLAVLIAVRPPFLALSLVVGVVELVAVLVPAIAITLLYGDSAAEAATGHVASVTTPTTADPLGAPAAEPLPI